MKGNLSKAGVDGCKLYYLGGLNLFLAFEDEIDALVLILNVDKWKEWFDSLDIWSGQTLAYEKLAWIKFHGVPLQLAENKVFDNVASLFGKVVKGSQLSSNNWDLSTNSVWILVDHGSRITNSVTLKWKNKSFKVWVMEELDDWVPDCMFEDEWADVVIGEDKRADASRIEKSEGHEEVQSESSYSVQVNLGIEGVQKVQGTAHVRNIDPVINMGPCPMRTGLDESKVGSFVEAGVGPQNDDFTRDKSASDINVVGGNFGGNFVSKNFIVGHGSIKNKILKKPKILAHSRANKYHSASPGPDRPLKRPRQSEGDHFYFQFPRTCTVDGVPGGCNQDTRSSFLSGSLDLNQKASSAETLVEDSQNADLRPEKAVRS
ncbi:hypothetical protein Hdeb2414_s0015g00440171 [Helianthus debilis subsp. tardiflorus]